MLTLRLFHGNDLTNQIESRPLAEGEIVIGRDPKGDWPVVDPDRAISRRHLTIANRGGLVTVRDTSANGVMIGDRRERIERDRAIPLNRGESISFGPYVLMLEETRDVSRPTASDREPEPFADPKGLDGRDEPNARQRSHPFASELKRDPFGQEGAIGDLDAWDRREEAPAGSWNAVSPHNRPDHTGLIGSDAHWTAPPAPPAQSAGYGFDAPFERPILETPPIGGDTATIPSDWLDAAQDDRPPLPVSDDRPAVPPAASPILPPVALKTEETAPPQPAAADVDAALFDRFCSGAGLDARHFAGQDRERLMERLGGVYRQTILGIIDLMRERTSLRNEYRMVHTTVRPEGNNPFKWAPPQRIAVELLLDDGSGYTTGERALNDALHDIKAHLLCMLAGMRAAMLATFGALQPGQVEARLAGKSFLLPIQRDAALWAEYMAMADALRLEAEDNPDSAINRAFRRGYEEQAAALDGGRDPWH